MPKVVIIPKWEIKKHADNQAFIGTLVANAAYEATLVPAEGETENRVVVFSIDNVYEKNVKGGKTQIIKPNIMFYEDGFREQINADDHVDVRDIISIHTVYVNRRFRDGRRKSHDDDPFVFTFINPKDQKPFSVTVDHNHFVGVTVELGQDRKRTYIGFLDYISEDGKICMSHMECFKGVFSIDQVSFDANSVKGVFNYHLVISDYEETMKQKKAAQKEEKRQKKKADKQAKKEAAAAEKAEKKDVPTEEPPAAETEPAGETVAE